MISLPNPKMTNSIGIEMNPMNFENLMEEFVSQLVEENYCKEDIYEFFEKYGESNTIEYYETYVTYGESHSYEAVDAFIEEFGLDYINNFEDAYQGSGYSSKGEYAEQYVTDCYSIELPNFIEIDWESTFDNLDYTYSDGFVFNNSF